jgi:anti-anti-sigma factor
MSFTVSSQFDGHVAKFTLTGRLDANTAPQFQKEIEKVAEKRPQVVVLFMEKLDYMASAGIRMLVFTKQKLGAKSDVYVIGAQEQIINTLEMTGVSNSVILADEFELAEAVQ